MKTRILVDLFDDIMWFILETAALPFCVVLAIIARFRPKRFDVGLGPESLINNVYHKMALERYGFSAETYALTTNFITKKYDHVFSLDGNEIKSMFDLAKIFWFMASRYRILYIYFNGGAMFTTKFLWIFEPFLYSLAKVKVVVMPYGGDVIDFTRIRTLPFKHAMTVDYPDFRLRKPRVQGQIDMWSVHADHIIAGCDWVDSLYHWDTLMIAHFSIDVDRLAAVAAAAPPTSDEDAAISPARPLRLLHAPNHQAVKGTEHLRRAVRELADEGVPIELELIEFRPNEEVLAGIARADVVIDQLIVGWYAMFAIEAMSMAKPVVCFLRDDLKELYLSAGLVEPNEIPLIDAAPATIKSVLRDLAVRDRRNFAELGRRSQDYVRRRHSLESVGKTFSLINRSLGVHPAVRTPSAEADGPVRR